MAFFFSFFPTVDVTYFTKPGLILQKEIGVAKESSSKLSGASFALCFKGGYKET